MTNLHQVLIPQSAGIYIIRNSVNANVYVGQASNLHQRIRSHKRALLIGRHGNPKLQRFVNKYGLDVLLFTVLETTIKDKNVLCEREQFYMDLYKPKFNISRCAVSTLGVKKSFRERQHMSAIRKGVKQTPEQIEAAAAPKRGKKRAPFTEEHRRRISEAKKGTSSHFKGKTHTDEYKKMKSEWAKARVYTDAFSEKMKTVTKGELNGMYGKKHSEETKAKIRAKRIAYNQRIKEITCVK